VGLTTPELMEASRLMLTGTPTSRLGRDGLEFINKNWFLKLIEPFPRVAVQSIERGIETSPLGFIPGVSNLVRRGAARVAGTTGPIPQLSRRQAVTRAGLGTALGGAGVAIGATGEVNRPTAFTGTAFAGPAHLPALLGFIIGEGLSSGSIPTAIMSDVIQQLRFDLPAPDVNAIERLLRGDQLIPGFVKTIANMSDPFERSTRGQGPLASIKRSIPGLRQQLPIRPEF